MNAITTVKFAGAGALLLFFAFVFLFTCGMVYVTRDTPPESLCDVIVACR